MTLTEKIMQLYPSLDDMHFLNGDIYLKEIDDSWETIPSDAVKVGICYIVEWNHPTLAQPTQAQLDAIGE